MTKKRIFVAGHQGMVGFALVRQLVQDPANEIVTRSRAELNLISQAEVADFFHRKNSIRPTLERPR